MRVSLTLNGEERSVEVEPRTLLVHLLRDELDLTGTHVGCDTSQCGSCTVLVDGRAAKSCTMLAAQADGTSVTTIEGLVTNGDLIHCRRRSSRITAFSAGSARRASSSPRSTCSTGTRIRTRRRSGAHCAATSAAAPATRASLSQSRPAPNG
jgi:hypothetical protein